MISDTSLMLLCGQMHGQFSVQNDSLVARVQDSGWQWRGRLSGHYIWEFHVLWHICLLISSLLVGQYLLRASVWTTTQHERFAVEILSAFCHVKIVCPAQTLHGNSVFILKVIQQKGHKLFTELEGIWRICLASMQKYENTRLLPLFWHMLYVFNPMLLFRMLNCIEINDLKSPLYTTRVKWFINIVNPYPFLTLRSALAYLLGWSLFLCSLPEKVRPTSMEDYQYYSRRLLGADEGTL